MDEKQIVELLKKIKSNALALYSHFHVAAILFTKTGRFFSGFNIENSSYGLTICAERVALFKALTEGEREFDRIYIMGDGDQPCTPCGACRQVLFDFARDVKIIMIAESGQRKERALRDLLPDGFGPENLENV